MSKLFEQKISKGYKKFLLEQENPEEVDPTTEESPAEEAPAENPAEFPEPEEDIDDDQAKLLSDLINLARKALLVNPKYINRRDYAKLTQVAGNSNMEDVMELVERIVDEAYPELEL